uniref:T-complex protein 1 subunit eta-like n=1 Tax=Rhizophora mucronata TaxID=61149 RepID=A0A2P2MJ00_RHIMU
MAAMLQPQIILLKEGTDTSQGKAQLVSNINACTAVADVVRTTLGPRGMDKLIHDDKGNVTISNDGATIMKLLDIVHPAAKILVDIAKSQDSEVGDGTTTVVLLAAEFLKEAKPFIEDGVHPQNLIRSYRPACNLAIEKVKELAFSIEGKSLEEKKSLLSKCAATTLSSKLIAGEKEFFASMVVDAVVAIGNDDRLNMIGIKKVPGGNMHDSFLVNGVAFKKTFSYAGFEQQPKKFVNPQILLLNIELELKSEKENAEIRWDFLWISSDLLFSLLCDLLRIAMLFLSNDAGYQTQHNISPLLMQNGILFMTSLINVCRVEPKLFFHVLLLVI